MAQIDRLAGVSSEAVQTKTGKSWTEWLAILDAADAAQMGHPQIARYLQDAHGVSDWWCQMITVGYEQARGLREAHQKTDGFTANASKTVAVPLAALHTAWADESKWPAWLGEIRLTVRKTTPGKSLRITWSDGSNLDVNLYAKGEGKSQVSLQHSKLPDAEAATQMKAFWSAALNRLKAFVEG